jgi:hypothetical protein
MDTVARHNLPSQRYNISDIGRYKVEALCDALKSVSDIVEVETRTDPYTASDVLPDSIVVLAVDSMSVRKEAMQALSWNPGHELVVESRMGGESMQLMFLDPCNAGDLKFWENMWFDDSEAEPLACGGQSVAFVGALSGGMIAAGVCRFMMQNEVTRFWSMDPSISLAPPTRVENV